MAADLEKLVVRLENVTTRLESVSLKGTSSGGSDASVSNDDPAWLDDYFEFHSKNIDPFVKATLELGGDVAELGKLVKAAFDAHKNLLTIAGRYNRPSATDLPNILKPLSDGITAVQNLRDSLRSSKQYNHLSALAEAIPYLGWVAVSPKPASFALQMNDSAQFYTNKILKEFRESDPKQADWAKSLVKLIKDSVEYIKDNHATGLNWNKEKPAANANTTVGGASAGGSAPPPPPGPPPPPVAPAPASSAPSGTDSGRSQLFADLNKGANVTSGLKKVSDDMKTHKNPTLRQQGPVQSTKSSALSPRPYSPPKFKKFNTPEVKKPPVFELQLKKWIVEYQENNQNLVIENTSDKQSVYMFRCKNSVLNVKGKVNSIVLDNCSKCGVVFTDLISACELVNCQSVKVQASGKVPTISIDKTDGAQVYLNKECLDVQIITAKSSEMNLSVPKDDGEFSEFPLPEQYKTTWNPDTNKFETVTMDLNL